MKKIIVLFMAICTLGGAYATTVAFIWSSKDKAGNRTKAEYIDYVFRAVKPAGIENTAYDSVSAAVINASVPKGSALCKSSLIAKLNEINLANSYVLTEGQSVVIDAVKAESIVNTLAFEAELDPNTIYEMNGMTISAQGVPTGVARVSRAPHVLTTGMERGLFIAGPTGESIFISSLFCFNISAGTAVLKPLTFVSDEKNTTTKTTTTTTTTVPTTPPATTTTTTAQQPIIIMVPAATPAPVEKECCKGMYSMSEIKEFKELFETQPATTTTTAATTGVIYVSDQSGVNNMGYSGNNFNNGITVVKQRTSFWDVYNGVVSTLGLGVGIYNAFSKNQQCFSGGNIIVPNGGGPFSQNTGNGNAVVVTTTDGPFSQQTSP